MEGMARGLLCEQAGESLHSDFRRHWAHYKVKNIGAATCGTGLFDAVTSYNSLYIQGSFIRFISITCGACDLHYNGAHLEVFFSVLIVEFVSLHIKCSWLASFCVVLLSSTNQSPCPPPHFPASLFRALLTSYDETVYS